MKAVFGMLKLRAGHVRLDGEDITALTPQARVAKGMAFVPQTSEHLHLDDGRGEPRDGGLPAPRRHPQSTMEQVYDLFPILKTKRYQAAGELSGGQRQQVAVGRALMTQPKVLMLDEPTAGVSPIVMDELVRPDHRGGPHRHLDPDGRTERPPGAGDRRQGLCAGARRNRFTDTGEALLADPEVRRTFLGG